MKILVAWADGSSTNLGVRALASGADALMSRIYPSADIEFQSFGYGPAPTIVTDRSLLEERLPRRRELSEWLASYDMILDMRAGDSFSDIYGMRRLIAMNELARIAKKVRTPVLMGPQTIGPFNTRIGLSLAKTSLRSADIVIARDPISAEYASILGRKVDALSTDLVFGIPAPDSRKNVDIALNVSGLLWTKNRHVDSDRYRTIVKNIYRGLVQRGHKVTPFAHVLSSEDPDNDVPAIRTMAEELEIEPIAYVPSDLTSVREFLASANLVIGSRMHACLNALSVGTPAISLSYSRKFSPLLSELGWGHTVSIEGNHDPVAQVLEASEAETLTEEVQIVRRRAEELIQAAEDIIRKRNYDGK